MGRKAEPFVFTLLHTEVAQLTETGVVGSGGLQSLQRRLKAELEQGSKVTFDDAQSGRLIRYMTKYDKQGGFEVRLRKAFIRPLMEPLAFEGSH